MQAAKEAKAHFDPKAMAGLLLSEAQRLIAQPPEQL
jgi:hypothetical protein